MKWKPSLIDALNQGAPAPQWATNPLVSACSGTGNDEQAYFAKHGASYHAELKGRRRLMAHDPVSAVR